LRYYWIILALAWIAPARASLSGNERLTIAVFDYAGMPGATLRPAVETARRSFHAAGIDTVWSICDFSGVVPRECTAPLPPSGQYVEMLVVPRIAAAIQSAAGARDVGGLALSNRPRAYAFYSTAQSTAALDLRPASLVLACILIHEIGHLLGLSHRLNHGIMRPNLSAREMDNVASGRAFDAWEMKRLRAGAVNLSITNR